MRSVIAMATFVQLFLLVWLFAAAAVSAAHGDQILMPLVTVGDPGNAPDPSYGFDFGSVPYVYEIGEYDVTVAQYTAFLNSVATTGDPYGLYTPGMATDLRSYGIIRTSTSGVYSYSGQIGKGPRSGTMCLCSTSNFGDSLRFINWMANNQPNAPEGPGTTETGSYNLNGGTSNAALLAVTRNPGATWVLPTRDEWYKSAFYVGGGTDSGYWLYATQSNYMPSNVLSSWLFN